MNKKRMVGIGLIVVGAGMLFFSNYIGDQISEGKGEIRTAEGTVDRVDSVFSLSKYTKPIGKQITGSAKKKIDAGKAEIERYESIESALKIGGIALIVVGIGFIVFSKKK